MATPTITGFTYVLDISKLDEILETLNFFNFSDANWFELGMKLGLTYPTLEAIEANEKNTSRCLMKCLSKWLSKADKNASSLTWVLLGSALRRIGEHAVADGILNIMADTASQLLQSYSGRLSQVMIPIEAVRQLQTEGVITEETLAQVERYRGSLVGDPLRALCVTVADDHNKLRVFGNVLSRFNETQSLGADLIKRCNDVFPVDPALTSSPETVEESGQNNEQPSNDIQQQTTQRTDEIHVDVKFNNDFDKMQGKYVALCFKISQLVEQNVSIDGLKSYVQRLHVERKDEIDSLTSVDKIMMIVEEKCTVINITSIEDIVALFNVKEAQDLIDEYLKEVDEFCTKIVEKLGPICEKKILHFDLLICETVTFVLDWNPDEHSLHDIRLLLQKAFNELDKRVLVTSIRKGNSIIVTCYAPQYLMNSLLLEVQGNLTVLVEKMSLIRLTIGHYTVYDKNIIDKEKKSEEEWKTDAPGNNVSTYEGELPNKGEETGIVGRVTWYNQSVVDIFSPSLDDCQKVISQLQDSHKEINVNKSSPDIFLKLMPEIIKRQTIKELRVDNTLLTLECIRSLSLSTNTSLQLLYLRNCSITDDVASVLCHNLHQNTTLTRLSLADNTNITSNSSSAFFELLEKNSILTYLNLQRTSLSSDAVLSLMDTLTTTNTTLKTLRIGPEHKDYYISEKGHNALESIKYRLDFD